MKTTLVFNLKQSLFFIRQGIKPEDIGYVGGKVFHKFQRTPEFEKAFKHWCTNGIRN